MEIEEEKKRLGGRSSDDDTHESDHEVEMASDDCMMAGPHTPTPAFAATSAEFHLFPRTSVRPRHGSLNTASLSSHSDTPSLAELNSLRSNAFWELQRSVMENGEGLVRRMRDYEHTRSRADTFTKVKDAQKRGKKRSSLLTFGRRDSTPLDDESDEEDEVQIFAGHIPQSFLGREVRHKTSSSSEAPTGGWSIPSSERCSSPCSSYYMTDDEPIVTSETDYQCNPVETPAPSCAATHDFSSSLGAEGAASMTAQSIPSSRSEKAIAALTLALANGSAGINDYDALRNLQPALALDDSQVGDMWH
ncbi:hypothetical protein PQX77_007125 [Marasmius sp. AFHP31]|nr:hypothetical protein PQX77_007125 [Marasmius sp. AFHP31]